MAYSCRVYLNTGFNQNNIPDDPTLLDTLSYIDVPALDILQSRFLPYIRVKATWEQIKNADYIRLSEGFENWFYTIDAITMQAVDVAEFSVTIDFISSVGGVNGFTILDGITDRVHVSDDNFGEYDDNDPLLTPAEPLQIKTVFLDFDTLDDESIYVESTVNPKVTAEAQVGNKFSYTDPVSGDTTSVDVPILVYNENITKYKISSLGNTEKQNGTCLYMYSPQAGGDAMTRAFAVLRSLGVEQCILNQVVIPDSMVTANNQPATSSYRTPSGGSIAYTYIKDIDGNVITESPNNNDFDYEWGTGIKNKLVEYSKYCRYGIITTAGNSLEAEAKDLYVSGDVKPSYKCIADPHPDGKPYFRFEKMNGDGSDTGFWRNCVAGMSWKQVPLVFTRNSGSLLEAMHVRNSIADVSRDVMIQQLQGGKGFLNSLINGTAGALGGKDASLTMAGVQGMSGALSGDGLYNAVIAKSFGNIEKARLLEDYKYSAEIATPTVNFPYNSEVMRDYMGNGILAYRYTYSQNDIQRIDKLLTMYGYKHTKPLETSDFNNRQYFNYVSCSDVTVGGHAKWINDGIGAMLRSGVRIWHTSPNTIHYTNNPVAV